MLKIVLSFLGAGAVAAMLAAGCRRPAEHPAGLRPANAAVVFVTRGSLEGALDANG